MGVNSYMNQHQCKNEGLQVIISKNIVFLSLKNDFVLANGANPAEMPHYMHFPAFHLGLQCLPWYPFRGFLSSKG